MTDPGMYDLVFVALACTGFGVVVGVVIAIKLGADMDSGLTTSGATIEPGEHITQFFAYAHLPPHLAEVSKPFADLADVVMGLPRNPERTVALRKLLEAKDAAVRARLAK